jgi:hypothetical protein
VAVEGEARVSQAVVAVGEHCRGGCSDQGPFPAVGVTAEGVEKGLAVGELVRDTDVMLLGEIVGVYLLEGESEERRVVNSASMELVAASWSKVIVGVVGGSWAMV